MGHRLLIVEPYRSVFRNREISQFVRAALAIKNKLLAGAMPAFLSKTDAQLNGNWSINLNWILMSNERNINNFPLDIS
jgi:hypothetical protein